MQDALVVGGGVSSTHHASQQTTIRALDAAEQQANLFRALYELAVAVAGMTNVTNLAHTIVEHAAALTGADAGGLYLLNTRVPAQ